MTGFTGLPAVPWHRGNDWPHSIIYCTALHCTALHDTALSTATFHSSEKSEKKSWPQCSQERGYPGLRANSREDIPPCLHRRGNHSPHAQSREDIPASILTVERKFQSLCSNLRGYFSILAQKREYILASLLTAESISKPVETVERKS